MHSDMVPFLIQVTLQFYCVDMTKSIPSINLQATFSPSPRCLWSWKTSVVIPIHRAFRSDRNLSTFLAGNLLVQQKTLRVLESLNETHEEARIPTNVGVTFLELLTSRGFFCLSLTKPAIR